MAASAQGATPAMRPAALDPFRFTWALLTNVKFALLLVGTAGVLALVGAVVPQVPGPMRQNAAARAAWIELRRNDYGALAAPMDRFGLFDIFHTAWFNGLWVVIIAAVTVCAVSRFMPTARSVHRPPLLVPDRYFDTAHHRAAFAHPGGADAVEEALRKRHYRVERTHEAGGATYVFAERYPWNQYGTFVSHLALLLLLVGGLLTRFAGFDRTMIIAETASGAPVFTDPGPGQMFVRVLDSFQGKDARGNIIDYHSIIEVRRGDAVKVCKTTVNDPCHAFGYKVHQAAFFNDLARLRVLSPTGQVLYDDVLDFEARFTAVPRFRVSDASGAVLFDQALPQMGTFAGDSPGPEDDVAVATLAFPEGAGSNLFSAYPVGWRVVGGELRVFVQGDFGVHDLVASEPVTEGRYVFEYTGAVAIPAEQVDDMPGAEDGSATVQMPLDDTGQPYLFISGIAPDNVTLRPGAASYVSPTGYRYEFGGRVEASGVSVRRDPGDTFIWVAVALAILGLAITFYVPRRRLWVKVTPARTYLAGIAEKTTRFARELRLMGAELGSKDALLPDDLTPE